MTDKHGCKADYEQEMSDYAEQHRHNLGECEGPPKCGYCLEEAENEKEER